MEDSGKEVDNSTSKFIAISVYIVGIIVNAYLGFEAWWELFDADFYFIVGPSLSLIFSFLAVRNYPNLESTILPSILHYFLSFIFWIIFVW